MRKVVLALVLVGAAFAGGVAMNGPGLDRLKAIVRSRLQGPAPIAPSVAPAAPKDVPSTPPPPLTIEPAARERRPALARHPEPMPEPPGEPRVALAPLDVAALEPPRPLLASPSPSPSPTTVDPAVATASDSPGPARDWSDVRRRMVALGVSRYEIEGEPGGRSRFRCLIPLAGRRAVGQQFEGEGDDDFQAAEAALRRIALWRATEEPDR